MTEKRNKIGQFQIGNVNCEAQKKACLGNTFNNKLYKHPEECQKAFNKYMEWIGSGKSIESFCYESNVMSITYKTLEKYIKEFPEDFPPSQKEQAQAKSLAVWEERGLTMMLGQIEKCQPAIFQMFMRNKFGWDKEDMTKKNSNETLVEKFLGIMDKMDDKKD